MPVETIICHFSAQRFNIETDSVGYMAYTAFQQ